ncbi:MAG TPA: DUF2933 domain-containing protein [Rhizomicrobium sp.]|nr:DUF2933 domain-containing protein [Rhizomicrobium sp.]
MSLRHQSEHSHRSSLQDWLGSRIGIVTCAAVAILAFLIYTGHTAHLLGFAPYLLLLACPLMHIFMHGGHDHRDNRNMDDKGGR